MFMTKAQREAAALERLKSKGDDQRKAYAPARFTRVSLGVTGDSYGSHVGEKTGQHSASRHRPEGFRASVVAAASSAGSAQSLLQDTYDANV